ncbi:MAG: hypothetical protein DBX55_05030 [Verrucomicrobia bacterium]|nr:MAG: hypothetical protein DBX55_05030 [Verrucomicrobiota bacterium]
MRIGVAKLITALVACCCALAMSACNSATTRHAASPSEYVCIFEYAGAVFSPVPSSAPFNYSMRDINGKFIAYVDTSRLVAQRLEPFIGKCVVIRGILLKLDGESVVRADSIRLKR